MQYLGGKHRLSKYICPILSENREKGQFYVEPFCGSMNIIQNMECPRIANDVDFYIIEVYRKALLGYCFPNEVSEDFYYEIKFNKEKYDPAFVAFVGYGCAYAGDFFAGYARNKNNRNYALAAKKNILKKIEKLKGCNFFSYDYRDLIIPDKSIIYCDPPYKNTTQYKEKFDHEIFYEWCIKKHLEGHKIFISELYMPNEFSVVWEKPIKRGARSKSNGYSVERLYTI